GPSARNPRGDRGKAAVVIARSPAPCSGRLCRRYAICFASFTMTGFRMSPSRFGQRLPQDQRHVHGRGRKGARPARALGAALLVAVWVLAGPASPALGARSDAFESLQRFFDQVDSYTARFEQVVFDEVGEPIQESRGRLWIERPNKFRWNYETPYEQQILSDGERLWVYDKDLQQVT